MLYALNLDPRQNLCRTMPAPELTPGRMGLRFYSGSVGISSAVESSSDMIHWSTIGVTTSAPDGDQVRTAAVNRAGLKCFMRLVVRQQ